MNKLTDCGVANLLGAILGKDPDLIKTRLGIPLPYTKCPNCDRDVKRKGRIFCNVKCKNEYSYITVSCRECGKLFKRRGSYLIWKLNHKMLITGKEQQRIFCSRKCLGKFTGRNFGFLAHPENSRHGRRRKWDWDLVLNLQRDTGYGAVKLSRLLQIPQPTISVILRRGKERSSLAEK